MEKEPEPTGAPPPYPGNPQEQTQTGYAPYPTAQAGYPAAQSGYPAAQSGYPAQPGYPAAQTGYAVYPPAQTTVVTTTQPTRSTVIIRGNQCPRCAMGLLQDHYSLCAILLAIFFFPLGLLCCLLMRQVRCTACGAVF